MTGAEPAPPGRQAARATSWSPRGRLTGICGCSRQRHFSVFAVSFPGQEALTTIYNTILAQHLAFRSVPMVVQKMSAQLVTSALGKLTAHPLPSCQENLLLHGADGFFVVSPGK